MKLSDVPDGSRIRVLGNSQSPPGARAIAVGEVLKFSHIDGMYSYCRDAAGHVVHLVAWAEVELVT